MTIKRYAGDKLVGVSSDTKPTNIPDGATFYETNTLSQYILTGGAWSALGGGGGANLTLSSNGSTVTVNSDSGTDVIILAANSTTAGVLTAEAQTIAGVKTFSNTIIGTTNNALYLNGTAASGYQTTAGLSANVATLDANNASYLGGTIASGYQTTAGLSANVATLASNNASYLGGTIASGYQTTAGLSSNVATLAANSATYVLANTGIVSNSTGVYVNSSYIATISANNASYLGGTIASGYQTTAGLSANVATLASNSSTYANGSVSNTFTVGTGTYFVSNGNVGVGNSSPVDKLSVNGNGYIGGNLRTTGSLQIDGNFTVSGNTVTLYSTNLSVQDNMIYLNNGITTTVTDAVANGSTIVYTANNNYSNSMVVTITGVSPSGYNLSSQTITTSNSTTFTIASVASPGSYSSGGTAIAKTTIYPDLGFVGGYNDGSYAHAGLFRDASDGRWKFFEGYTPEPDASAFIDTSNTSFTLSTVQANTFVGALNGTANNALYLDGTIASGYQTTAGLSANVATLTSNNSTYFGGYTWAAPSVVGGTTANGASFTYANVSGQVNTATLYATTSANVASVIQANSTGMYISAGSNAISLSNGSSNWIYWGDAGATAPTFTTRSAGTKLVLYPALTGSQVDYAMGIEPATLWSSVPVSSDSFGFKWYGGTTQAASLTGAGNLTLAGTANATAYYSGTLFVANNTVVYATHLGNTAASSYQTTAGLSSNVATLTSNNASYLGGTIASGYQTTAGLSANVATLTSNNASYFNGQAAAYYANASNIGSGTLSPSYGGTGVNNGAKTITIGGNVSTANSVTTSGNFALTLTQTAATNVTLPTTGTLATLDGSETLTTKTLSSATLSGTLTANGSVGTAGQVLTSNATGVYWSTVSGGGGGGANLTLSSNGSTVSVNSDSGTDVIILAANSTTAGVLTAEAQTIAGVKTFNSNVTISAAITANGSVGTAGQVLTSNASGVYWSTVSGGVTTGKAIAMAMIFG